MKKIYLSFLLLTVSLSSHAQSFTVSGPKTIFSLAANKGTGKYTFFNFETGKEINTADSNSTNWHIGFSATTIILNGGTSGPGTVSGQVVSSDFEDLTLAPSSGYVTDNASGKAITSWYHYSGAPSHLITPLADMTFAILLADGSYVKMEVISYYLGAPLTAGGTSRHYTFRYLHSQTSDLDTKITSVTNLRANYSNFQFFNLSNADTVLTSDSNSTKWDIAFKGTTIIVNSGFGGPDEDSAQVVAVDFDTYNTAPLSGWDYDDATGKAIPTGSGNGWYNYSGPPSHLITPIANRTILVKTFQGRYVKIIIESYYKDGNTANTSSHYSFSYYFQPDGTTSLSTSSVATGIHKGKDADELITIYPNPFDGNNLHIQSVSPLTNTKLTVSDAQGIEVVSNTTEDLSDHFTLSDLGLTPGMYMLQIETGSETLIKKIMVK